MKENNVIIISDNKNFAANLASKILLLRSSDSVGVMDYKKAGQKANNHPADLVLIHTDEIEQLNFIKTVKNFSNLKRASILLVSDNRGSDFLCRAFDFGIDDFIEENADETVLNMRIMWCLKKKLLADMSHKKSSLLTLIEVTDKNGYFEKTYTQMIFEREYKKCLTRYDNTIFMILSADIRCKSPNANKTIEEALAKTLRKTDVCGHAPDEKFYLLLYKTDEKGAKKFFQRLNNVLPFETSVSAAAMSISGIENFKVAEKSLNKKLIQSLTSVNAINIVETAPKNLPNKPENVDRLNDRQKNGLANVKYLQRDFAKRMEKLISPAFFKMQAIYEPKLFNTDILQVFNSNECRFIIKKENNKSEIVLKYNNDRQIGVEISETFKFKVNKEELSFSQEEFTSEKVENIIQTVAEKFRKNLYKNEDESIL